MAFTDIDVEHDIPDGLGFNKAGTIRYIDKDLFDAIMDGRVHVATGLTPEQIVECLVANIEAEKEAYDADPDLPWHDVSIAAHRAEARKVTEFGGDIDTYDKALAPLFIACKRKAAKNRPDDLVDLESGWATPTTNSPSQPRPAATSPSPPSANPPISPSAPSPSTAPPAR